MSRLAEQMQMMEQMLQIQARVRVKKEQDRIFKTGQSEKYTRIFEPITKSLINLRQQQPNTPIKPRDLSGGVKTEEDDEVEDAEDSLYDAVLESIPLKNRDDGVFGLKINTRDPHTGIIGGHDFVVVNDNVLVVRDGDTEKKFSITDPNLWRLLLVKYPKVMLLKRGTKYLPFVRYYKEIVDQLDLVKKAFDEHRVDHVKKRKK